MSLYDLKCGQKGIITNITGDKKLIKRLFALGFIEGTEIKLKAAAPLGDPLIIHIRDFNIALRKKDAKNIFLKEA